MEYLFKYLEESMDSRLTTCEYFTDSRALKFRSAITREPSLTGKLEHALPVPPDLTTHYHECT